MNIDFTQREIDWLNNYAGNHDMGISAAVRHAVRMLSLVEATPGAREALEALNASRMPPKYQPMEPLPQSQGDKS